MRLAMLLVLLTGLCVAVAPSSTQPAAAAESAGVEGNYVALAKPVRILSQQLVSGGTTINGVPPSVDVTAIGVPGVPRAGTKGLVLGVTAINQTSAEHDITITPYPLATGTTQPRAVRAVRTRYNLYPTMNTITVPVDETRASAHLKVAETGGIGTRVNVYLDVMGYYTTSTTVADSGGFVAVREQQLFNTATEGTKAPIAASATVSKQIAGGTSPVPLGATSAYLQLEASGMTATGGIVAVPGGTDSTGAVPAMRYWTGGGRETSLVVAKLAANGTVDLKNTGTAGVHLKGRIVGYSTSSPLTGADWRATDSTTIEGTLAAGVVGDLTLADGVFKPPALGYAGVFANLEVINPTSDGNFLMYPTGQADNTNPALTFTPVQDTHPYRRSGAILVPGSDGRVRIKNASSADIYVRIKVHAWFEGPTDYAAAGGNPVVAAAQTSAGPCYGYVDAAQHTVRAGCGSNASDTTIDWSTISPTGHEFRGPVSVVAKPGGRFVVSALHVPDGELWMWDLAHSSGLLESTTDKHVRTFRYFKEPLAAATLPDGTPWGFTVDVRGQLWAANLNITAPNLPTWKALDMVPSPGVTDLSATATPTGIRVAGVTPSGDVLSGLFTSATTTVGLRSLGASQATGRAAVGVSTSGAARVAVKHTDDTIWSANLDAAGAVVGGWNQVSTTYEGAAVALAGNPTFGYDPRTGRNALLFWSNANGAGALHGIWENGPDSGRFDANPVGYINVGTSGIESDVTAWDFRSLPQPSTPAWAIAYADDYGARIVVPNPVIYGG